tara:strand:- start:180 stop:428 length:249 start_codon:yes stop_codon:yes gene_type:complete
MSKTKTMEKVTENKNVHVENAAPQAEAPAQTPVFEEIEGMDQNTAVSVIIQAAEMAQKAGALSMRDSVVLAKAISILVPGKV